MKKIIIDEVCFDHDDRHFGEHDDFKHHFKKEFKDEFQREFRKHRKGKPFVKMFGKKVKQTKMFESKKELVDFVNQIGEDGTEVDIFKIEDGLYKVVVFKKEVE